MSNNLEHECCNFWTIENKKQHRGTHKRMKLQLDCHIPSLFVGLKRTDHVIRNYCVLVQREMESAALGVS
jgi:hypothetical protein